MPRKIFVSYKYGDSKVLHIPRYGEYDPTTARHYVDVLQAHLAANDHINKGEADGEDMSGFKDETIASNLRDKIYDSSTTLVLISKNMKDNSVPEEDQWIPWEVAYSLREKTREDRSSRTNAMLAVVIPDENGSYEYFVQPIGCAHCGGIRWKQDTLFQVLGKNMFNKKQPQTTVCPTGICGVLHTGNDHSYIHPVRWDHFITDINFYLDHATRLNENINNYNLVKVVN
ncbi:MAG: TIR domain-containing protein [Candidatus Pacebacteria bacterium]|nr:TIR domain-containing protein [Candidatus Paceibacterota bacterium]